MSVSSASPAAQWLNGVPIGTSTFLFFIGAREADLRAELARRGWSGRVITLAPPAFNGLDELAATLEPDSEHPVVALDPAVMRGHREAVKQIARQIARTWFGALANQEAKRQNGARYRTNTLRNASQIAREADASVLAGACAGFPALVVGAGPSLDRNLADIAAYRERAIIIAADTALRPLLAAGVEPHLVVAADPSETNARHLCDLPPCPRTALVAEGSVDPESLKAFAGRTFFFRVGDHDPWPWLIERGLDRGRLRSWGSVLTTAFDLARVMGCAPIVFAGADLAFTEDRPYAHGTTYEESWYQNAAWGQPIESSWAASIGSWPETFEDGVDGRPVRTAPHLRSFRDWIATEAGKAPRGSVLNGTGAGILVGEGLTQTTVAGVLRSFGPVASDARARIAACRLRGRTAASSVEIDAASGAAWQLVVGTMNESTAAPDPEVILASGDLVAQIEAALVSHADRRRIVCVDRTGVDGGAPVRRALFAVLENHPELSARYGRFFNPRDDRSWIERRPVSERNPGVDRSKWGEHHVSTANRLTPLIVGALQPKSVFDVGCGDGAWMRAFEANGVTDVGGVEEHLADCRPSRRFDLALCLGVVHRVPMEIAQTAIDACATASDTIVFSVPAAAIGEPGFINERPWSFWHRAFIARGFAPSDELRPLIEERFEGFQSSFDLVMVYRRVCSGPVDPPVADLIVRNANRCDDQVLHRHWQTHLRATASLQRPRTTFVDFEIPPARMEAGDTPGERLFRFRSVAGVLSAADCAEPVVSDAGVTVAAFLRQGVVAFRAKDATDPRHNGRSYTLRMPAYVAFLEEQAPATIVQGSL